MLLVAFLIGAIVILLLLIEIALWACLAALCALVAAIIWFAFGAEALTNFFAVVSLLSVAVAVLWLVLRGEISVFGKSRSARAGPPEDPHERYLWANRLEPYSGE